jgi:urea transport system permease protein
VQTLVTQVLNALTLIALFELVALGLAIAFGLMGIINLAHGEFVMLGAYTVVVLSAVGLPIVATLFIVPVVVGLIGTALEEVVLQRMYTRPLDTLLATWGLSLIIRQIVKIVFGAKERGADALLTGTVTLAGITYPLYRLFVIAAGVVIGSSFLIWIFRSSFGVQLRAVIANREMAAAMGINDRRVDRIAFSTGAGIAGLAGAIIAPLATINPQMGLSWLVDAFLVVIIGGAAPAGVLAGATFIGGTESTLDYFLRPVVASIVVLVAAVTVLRFLPQGLTGRRR